jgi:carbon storage regulator
MLVLSRRIGEEIHIGDTIRLKVVRVDGRRVRIGIIAPGGVQILRGELAADWPEEPSAKEEPAMAASV